jgi:hypothetical protein
MQADECDRQCVREPAQCSLRRRGRREITGPRDVTCVSYWAGARPLDSTTQDTGPRGAFCSRGVWGLPGCLSVRPAVKIHSFSKRNYADFGANARNHDVIAKFSSGVKCAKIRCPRVARPLEKLGPIFLRASALRCLAVQEEIAQKCPLERKHQLREV